MQTYQGAISPHMGAGNIFVFGSNTQGRHGRGAALFAKQHYGAVYGSATGPQGQSYAIITKDLTKPRHPSVSTTTIEAQIMMLYHYAKMKDYLKFWIPYSGSDSDLNSNLNGYSPKEMAQMFAVETPPSNIVFEHRFAMLVLRELKAQERI